MILLMGFSLNGLAQKTGVNTKNPQGAVHVDAKNNNATTGAPPGTQPDDDFIVDASGNVGIGVLAPLTKLHLISGGTATAPISAIRIEDGSQGRNYVLLSDANGSAKWVNHPVMTANVVGDVVKGTEVISNLGGSGAGAALQYRETGFSITLSEGDWIVNTGLTFVQIGAGESSGNLTFWQRAYLSSSTSTVAQVGFSHLGIAGLNTCYGGPMHDNPTRGVNSIGFVTGSSIINVPPGATTKIYLLIENQPMGYYIYNSDYLETYFYATPIVKSP